MAKKILVVDDESHIRILIKSRLEKNNYEVVVACDGEECLKKVVSEKPDLIILDIMMPKMDGYSTLIAMKEMREMTETATDIPVVVLSARGDSKVRDLVESEEIAGYILKPFDGGELIEKVKQILPV